MLVECKECEAIVDGQVISEYEDYEEASDMTEEMSIVTIADSFCLSLSQSDKITGT